MNIRTLNGQHLIRTVAVAAFVVMLVITSAQRAEANQSGPSINDATNFQAALCEAAGGTATIDTDRTVGEGLRGTWVKCTGGLLGGMHCANWNNRPSFCFFERTTGPTGDDFHPVEQVEVAAEPEVTPEPAVNLPVVVEESVDPGTAEEPVTDQGDGSADDLPEITEDVVEPVVAEEPVVDGPVIEEVATVEESVDTGEVIEPIYEVAVDVGIEIEQPILVGE